MYNILRLYDKIENCFTLTFFDKMPQWSKRNCNIKENVTHNCLTRFMNSNAKVSC